MLNPKDFKIVETFISKSDNLVFLVEDNNTKQKCVGKVIFKKFLNSEDQTAFLIKVQELQQLENPSISKIIGISNTNFFDEKYPTIFTEYQINQSLRQLLPNRWHELSNTGKYINLIGIAFGIEYLHSQHVIHGHLTPEKVLLDENYYPHINDYGTSTTSEEVSSYLYMSPEFLESEQITQKSDIYSYSLIAYSIITGREPYDASDFPFCIDKIIKGKRPELKFIENSKLKKFLSKCWSKDPNDRPMPKEIISTLLSDDFYSIFDPCLPLLMNFLNLFPDHKKELQLNKIQPFLDS